MAEKLEYSRARPENAEIGSWSFPGEHVQKSTQLIVRCPKCAGGSVLGTWFDVAPWPKLHCRSCGYYHAFQNTEADSAIYKGLAYVSASFCHFSLPASNPLCTTEQRKTITTKVFTREIYCLRAIETTWRCLLIFWGRKIRGKGTRCLGLSAFFPNG